jgi:hypothetical protein
MSVRGMAPLVKYYLKKGACGNVRVPVGIGIVVPAQRIVELIRGDSGLIAYRKYRVDAVKKATAATQDHAKQDAAFAALLLTNEFY